MFTFEKYWKKTLWKKKKKLVKTHMKIFSYQYNQVLGLTAFFRLPIGSKKAEYLLFEKEKYSQSVMPTIMKFMSKSKPFHEFLFDSTIFNEIEPIDWFK